MNTWRNGLIAILVASGCVSAFPQSAPRAVQGKLSGDVADKVQNAPIAKAFVLVHQPEGKKDFIVKVANGRFELSLAPGSYDVFVSAAGFDPTCRSVRIAAGTTAEFKPRLARTVDSAEVK